MDTPEAANHIARLRLATMTPDEASELLFEASDVVGLLLASLCGRPQPSRELSEGDMQDIWEAADDQREAIGTVFGMLVMRVAEQQPADAVLMGGGAEECPDQIVMGAVFDDMGDMVVSEHEGDAYGLSIHFSALRVIQEIVADAYALRQHGSS